MRAPVSGSVSALRCAARLPVGAYGDRAGGRARADGGVLVGGGVLCLRAITLIGSVDACQRGEIAGVRDLVTLVGGIKTRAGGLHALAGGALADVEAVLVRALVEPGREVAVADGAHPVVIRGDDDLQLGRTRRSMIVLAQGPIAGGQLLSAGLLASGCGSGIVSMRVRVEGPLRPAA